MSNAPKAFPDPKPDGGPPFQMPPTLPGPRIDIAQGAVPVPSDPPHSTLEAASLHSRIIEVTERWGVSYRDAAYMLFLVTADVAHERNSLREVLMVHKQNIEAAQSLLYQDSQPQSPDNRTSSMQPTRSPVEEGGSL
ncbi:hypothetical protein ONZ45_g9360 [Pleurotus djamor]|nr:hypothetical protein ONZ45_g9360 [Pleurotus djamor]